ncbi:hypothetical protein CTA1_7554 [Colletotrichum tanaceti]|uniref:Uncharacterized protein n=1 Tax=Colletotrichum tanaceti TaxID=1306861 RepID=A0A4U6XRB2_9PEZI|nr:hypothetical protein CTA1_7554 [Colletotrichum tanaceti]
MMRGHGGQQGQGQPEGEMVEIDVLQGHHHPHQHQYQPPYQNGQQQNQFQEQYQEYSQNPYDNNNNNINNNGHDGHSPYETDPNYAGQEAYGRALTNNANSPYQQQQDQFHQQQQQQQYQQPHAVSVGDDYGPPGWANRHSIGMAGAPSIGPSISGMDTPVDSRAATPTLRSGMQTPFDGDHLPPPRHPWSTDSTPNSPMVRCATMCLLLL